jgi:hypothetical protein
MNKIIAICLFLSVLLSEKVFSTELTDSERERFSLELKEKLDLLGIVQLYLRSNSLLCSNSVFDKANKSPAGFVDYNGKLNCSGQEAGLGMHNTIYTISFRGRANIVSTKEGDQDSFRVTRNKIDRLTIDRAMSIPK